MLSIPPTMVVKYHCTLRVRSMILLMSFSTWSISTRQLSVLWIERGTLPYITHVGAKCQATSMLLDKFDAMSVSKRNAQNKLPIELLWKSKAVEDRESIEYTDFGFWRLTRSLWRMLAWRFNLMWLCSVSKLEWKWKEEEVWSWIEVVTGKACPHLAPLKIERREGLVMNKSMII